MRSFNISATYQLLVFVEHNNSFPAIVGVSESSRYGIEEAHSFSVFKMKLCITSFLFMYLTYHQVFYKN